MTEKHVISFSAIHEFFKNNSSQLKKGENAYKSGHVIKMVYDSSVQPPILKGDVLASMKKKTYPIEIILDKEKIIDAKCSCPRGQAICHHMAALVLYGHYNISVTDTSCAWNVRKPSGRQEKKISDIYPSQAACGARSNVSNEAIERFKKKLGMNKVGFTWLLQAPPSLEVLSIVPQIEDILFSADYINSDDKQTYFVEKLKINSGEINLIKQCTEGQASNENWLVARKHRLTASKFDGVLGACERNQFPPSLFRNLVEGYNINSVRAVQWGKSNEVTAIEVFKQKTSLNVLPSGLWLHECGFLGASPDGIVVDGIDDDAIIEAKCPYKFRNLSLSQGLRDDKSYIVYYENDTAVINANHNYYHQIQGLLYICQKNKCYLIIWTPGESEIFLIEKDEQWAKNIDILKDFYLTKLVPYIISMR